MDSLVEFMHFTKGTTYLISIAFLFAFLAFWLLVNQGNRQGLAIRIVPLLILALGFGGLASTCVSPEETTTANPANGETPLVSSAVLVEMYGPASFDHGSHQALTEDCTVCHHYSGSATPACKECHNHRFNPENLNKPGVACAYHLRCISCHKENQSGPTDCTGCHTKAIIPPLSIDHPLAGVESCLTCHGVDIPGMPNIPGDHSGATNGVCQLCHQPTVDPTALAKRELPHGVEGREDCLLCHGEGIAGAGSVPADHAGRTNNTCQICHKPSTDDGPTPPVGPQATPHEVEGQEDCLLCHGVDMSEVVRVPADHAGTSNETCLNCHGLPHEVEGREDCLVCHGEGIIEAAGVPADHDGGSNETCLNCHGLSHDVEGREYCLVCHGEGIIEATGMPIDHAGSNDICQGCHVFPHEVEEREDCLLCHEAGISGAAMVPEDHSGTLNDSCLTCHGLPHEVVEREDCLLCHEEGIAGAIKVLDDHSGRMNDTCLSCHELSHDVEEREYCLLCHEADAAVPAIVPTDHSNRTSDTCFPCHGAG